MCLELQTEFPIDDNISKSDHVKWDYMDYG